MLRLFQRIGLDLHHLAVAVLLCGLVLGQPATAEAGVAVAESVVAVEVFTRPGCPHCDEAKVWLGQLTRDHPEIRVAIADVSTDLQARHRLQELAQRHGSAAVSVPAFWLRGRLVVGFDRQTSPGHLEALLRGDPGHPLEQNAQNSICSVDAAQPCTAAEAPPEDRVVLPWLGAVQLRRLGLPLFTVAIGLVDGFNPCAMWVLLFLLSFLASLSDRKKMLLIAGEFVLVSGAVYYAFMAAWLTAFALIGYSRSVQVALGLIGLAVGAVNIKEFFAFHRGLTLSIPESAKPGLYRRMRAVVRAESLPVALLGAAVLAVLVNFVELLCTAGLPALYTQVLAQQPLAPWQRYAYLGLYNLAYIFDDALMVTLAVATLSRAKLQERGGRWLKLLSGAVMTALALLLLFKPEWLA